MTERSPFLSAGWGRYQMRGLSFANCDGSSLPREPMGARMGLGSAPSGECPLVRHAQSAAAMCVSFPFAFYDRITKLPRLPPLVLEA
jgi:hypothetical protein